MQTPPPVNNYSNHNPMPLKRSKRVHTKWVLIFCYGVIYGLMIFFWTFIARNNFWLMFVPPVCALWFVVAYNWIRLIGLMTGCCTCRWWNGKCIRYTPYLFWGILGFGVIIFSVVGYTKIAPDAQSWWGWSQDIEQVDGKDVTVNKLNVDNCYGPKMVISDILTGQSSEWVAPDDNDYKQLSFGLISSRQLTFKLNRLILPTEQWKCDLTCESVWQAPVPCDNVKALKPGDRIGKLYISSSYSTYSNLVFISLIVEFGLELILWTIYVVWQYWWIPPGVHWYHMFHGWVGYEDPSDDDDIKERNSHIMSSSMDASINMAANAAASSMANASANAFGTGGVGGGGQIGDMRMRGVVNPMTMNGQNVDYKYNGGGGGGGGGGINSRFPTQQQPPVMVPIVAEGGVVDNPNNGGVRYMVTSPPPPITAATNNPNNLNNNGGWSDQYYYASSS
jgi:hypothetical protein